MMTRSTIFSCLFVYLGFHFAIAQTTQVRLVGGTNGTGRVEVFYKNFWNSIFGNYLQQADAEVLCRMLGFNDSGIATVWHQNTGLFGHATGHQIVSALGCRGNETDISQCGRGTWSVSNSPATSNHDGEISCEATPIRLMDGDTVESGRVELSINNKWFTVCDSSFDQKDAKVICRMLGYGSSNVSKPFTDGHFGLSHGGIIVSNLNCYGDETDIKQCAGSWGTSVSTTTCDHRSDAGVSCGTTPIRLVDGPSVNSGRVEVLHAGKWGTICASGATFSKQNVMVICRMLGVNNPNAFGYATPLYGEGYAHIGLVNLNCDGSENDIAGCRSDLWAGPDDTVTNRCPHSHDVAVNCDGRTQIRLVDGDSEQSGRVEIFTHEHWGTVSDRYFDNHDLQVVCRMLGYESSGNAFFMPGSFYGPGTGKVLVTHLQCNGDEMDIGQCVGTWTTSSTDHSHDVGVSCDGMVPARVIGGSSNSSGRVEFLHQGYYRSICTYGFDRADLIVVCKMLGFESIPRSASWRTVVNYNMGIGEIGVSDLACDGTEVSIVQCKGTFPASSRCFHNQDVYVNCNGDPDEVRLVNGTSLYSGRVEIKVAGRWGTFCGIHGFRREDAIVICRMLNVQSPELAVAYSDGRYGQGSIPIVLTDLRCNGIETNLAQCSVSAETHYCTHTHDVGVDCCPMNDCDSASVIG